MLIDTFISLFGLGYNHVSGIRQARKLDQIIEHLRQGNTQIEKLSEHIFYQPDNFAVMDSSRSKQSSVENLRKIRESLEPIQRITHGDLLSGAVIVTPEQMQSAINQNPWQVLDSIRPVQFAEPHHNRDMVPIIFVHEGQHYLGWQMKGIIPSLFGCKFNPEGFYSDELSSASDESLVLDKSLGIETLGGKFTMLFERGVVIPAKTSQIFSTAQDYQTAVTVHILSGYGSYASETTSLGRFDMNGIPPARRGVPQIEVSFEINENGVLLVTAEDKATRFRESKQVEGISLSRGKVQVAKLIISCLQCGQKLRIPRNTKGIVTCSKCRARFQVSNGVILTT